MPVDERGLIQSGLQMAVGQLDDCLRLVVSYHMGWSDLHGQEVNRRRGQVNSFCTSATGGAGGGVLG